LGGGLLRVFDRRRRKLLGAVDLRTEHHSSAAVAAAAYTLFTATMAFARLFGDRAQARFGRVRIVQYCSLTAAAGALLVVFAWTTAAAMIGWMIIGVGLAVLAPTVLGAAPSRATKTRPAAAIAAVTTLGYLGSFTGPPIVGGLASLIGLSAALRLLAAAGGIAALLAPVALREGGAIRRLGREADRPTEPGRQPASGGDDHRRRGVEPGDRVPLAVCAFSRIRCTSICSARSRGRRSAALRSCSSPSRRVR
jgi:MFS family permease